MSQRAEEGASVFTAFLQAWERETRKPAWRRADLETKRGRGWPGAGAGSGGELRPLDGTGAAEWFAVSTWLV